jgi:hypothetical protein
MPGNKSTLSRCKPLPLIISLIVLLIFTLAACGTNSSSITGGGVASTPTTAPTPTATAGQNSAEGCPQKTPLTATLPQANVVLKSSSSNKSVNVKKGDTVEIDLAFGHNWEGSGNISSKALLTEQASGYADTTTKMCVWRFLTIRTGTAHLDFIGRPICPKGALCPQYVQAVSFILEIK